MANKTIDRKKAVPARSQAAKTSPKNAPIKASRPAGNTPAKSSTLTPEKSASAEAEVLEAEELETEEPVDEADADANDESDEEEPIEDEAEEVVEEEEEEEEEVVEKPAKTRAKGKKGRDLVVVSPQDYSVSRTAGQRRLPNFPGSKFLYASYRELRLVTWPSRHDVWTWSLVVIGVCIAIAIVLGLADFGLSKFVTWWLSLAH